MKNRPFLLALPFGLLTLVLALTMPSIPRETGVRNPIVELEFARSAADVQQVLGTGEEVREATLQSVRADRFFLLAYSAFLAVSCFLSWRKKRQWGLLLGIVLSVAAAIFDHFENQQLFQILRSPDADWPSFLSLLSIFTWIKWGAIAAVFLLLGWSYKDLNRFGRVFLAFAGFTALIAVEAVFLPVLVVPFSTLVALLFLLLFLFQLTYSNKPQA
ncbi:MAG: hypothetical protein H6563_11165 [Lewinellaceae bacterium]|nr:hypothetical protein [Lewinellaceae bacterium]